MNRFNCLVQDIQGFHLRLIFEVELKLGLNSLTWEIKRLVQEDLNIVVIGRLSLCGHLGG
jgi:hypothetical protein